MSLNVLVLGEDMTSNGAILRPVVQRLMEDVGRGTANVFAPSFAGTQGYAAGVERIRSGGLDVRYGHFDLWIFVPDADLATDEAMRALEQCRLAGNARLLCCPAIPELEAWALAGYADHLGLNWGDARKHLHLKEEVFVPLAQKLGLAGMPGGGRVQMILHTLKNWRGFLERCPEIKTLRERIAAWITKD